VPTGTDAGTRRNADALKRLDDGLQERLINWGYAISDAALRKHVDPTIAKRAFPYPGRDAD
jgi:NTE family protein